MCVYMRLYACFLSSDQRITLKVDVSQMQEKVDSQTVCVRGRLAGIVLLDGVFLAIKARESGSGRPNPLIIPILPSM